ncbi:MAG TPA: lamin tail domain-containing protein, partial [Glycomyces sp.]|nr:lamin tail domain-containing protein [Glycomyces sp.]
MSGGRAQVIGVIAALLHAACQFDPSGPGAQPIDGGPEPDSGEVRPDGGGGPSRHLLLSEIKASPNEARFVEIYNPSCSTVDLSDYYLTDAQKYAFLPSWTTPEELSSSDQVVRFPAGATLGPGGVAVIAGDGDEFMNAFEREPDFALEH